MHYYSTFLKEKSSKEWQSYINYLVLLVIKGFEKKKTYAIISTFLEYISYIPSFNQDAFKRHRIVLENYADLLDKRI